MNRRTFMGVAGSALLTAAQDSKAAGLAAKATALDEKKGLKVRFLGTGAADWHGRDERGELRRLSSILLDGRILIDFTKSARDMLPEGCHPETIFYTHSHDDHFNAEDAIELGIKTAYLSQTWFDIASSEFAAASRKLSKPAPQIIPVCIGQVINIDGLAFHPLPANHATGHILEQTLIYLVEKGPTRLLYATDTAGLTAVEIDFRLFAHSSVATVEKTLKVLTDTGRYLPRREGQFVYLTHMARTLHGTQAELDAQLPQPIRAAYDGLEVVF